MLSLYCNTKIKKNSSNKQIIEGTTSLIFIIEDMNNKPEITIEELKYFLYNNIKIRIYINIVKTGSNKELSFLLYSIMTLYNKENNTISLSELKNFYINKQLIINKSNNLTIIKIKNTIKKYIDIESTIKIID
jgi:hypothetical protein